MKPWNSNSPPPFLLLRRLFLLTAVALLSLTCSIHASPDRTTTGGGGSRVLLSFKETPHGSNVTFDCSPSGPCVPCLYSEKSEEKYRCSETGYRIPFKCVEIKDIKEDKIGEKSQNGRSVVEVSQKNANPTDKDESQIYITYRSCIPAVNEEKLSVIGFEGIILFLLLASGSVVYFRRKRSVTMPGAGGGRIQMSSRF